MDVSKVGDGLRKTQYRLYGGLESYIDVSINYIFDRRTKEWIINRQFRSLIRVFDPSNDVDEIQILMGDIEEVSQETLEFCADKMVEIAFELGLISSPPK